MSVSRTLTVLAMLAVILGAWFFATSAASQAAGASPPEQPATSNEPVVLLKSDSAGITLEVELSGLVLEQDLVDEVMYDTVTAPGFGLSTRSGSPQVPTRRVLLGIPLGADYHLHISADQSETVPNRYKLLPAPTPILQPASDSEPQLDPQVLAPGAAGWDYIEDERAYSKDALYPDAIAQVVSSGFIRDQRFVAVQVNPVQYNPVTGELVLHKQITVQIDFTYPRGRELGATRFDTHFEPVLRAGLLNYESAANWRGRPDEPVPTVNLAKDIRDASSPALKIMVDEDGIYQVTAADLNAVYFPVGEPAAYKLLYRDREVPIRVLEEAGIFGSLWFYGEQARTKYTDTNVYWLKYEPGPDPGLPMPLRDAAPVSPDEVAISHYYWATVRLEEDHWYRSYMPSAEDLDTDPWDHWFWTYSRYVKDDPDPPPNLAFPVQLSDLDTNPYSATLRASLTGWTGETLPDYGHCVEFFMNDQKVGSHAWTGKYQEQLVSFAITSTLLLEGASAVEVGGCESDAYADLVFYDWFELDVRRSYQADDNVLTFDVPGTEGQYQLDGFTSSAIEVFAVSGTYTVSQLAGLYVPESESPYSVSFYDDAAEQGTRYVALTREQIKSPSAIVEAKPPELRSWPTPPDYIIIAPEEFEADVGPLADHRAAQGLEVRIADLELVFDEFNHGIYSPEAIRAFLEYEYDHWDQDPPSFVLLVGDGTYDYKNNLNGNPKLLPPFLAWVDPWYGEEAADNRYVTVAGDDPFPDMHIGRFPAETSDQVQAMVEKTIDYETNSAPRNWIERVLLVAEDPDDAGDFHAYSDDLVNNYLPDPYVPTKAYYGDTCLTGAECEQVILNTLNNTGALLVNYVGHGSLRYWTDNGVWDLSSLDSLGVTDRLPVILSMTCFDGAFHQDKWMTFEGTVLAEAMVRLAADRGAVASWSPTGAGVASGHDSLNKGFLEAALYDGVRQLGVAADAGKARVFASGYYTELLETYHLFGDPALRLNSIDVVDVAVGQSIESSPSNKVQITLSFTNKGPDLAVGVVLTDVIPIELIDPTVVFASPEVLEAREGITFAWTITNLLPGASGEIVLEADMVPDEDVSFFNVAQIGVETHDLVPANNVSWAGLNLKSVYLPVIMRGN